MCVKNWSWKTLVSRNCPVYLKLNKLKFGSNSNNGKKKKKNKPKLTNQSAIIGAQGRNPFFFQKRSNVALQCYFLLYKYTINPKREIVSSLRSNYRVPALICQFWLIPFIYSQYIFSPYLYVVLCHTFCNLAFRSNHIDDQNTHTHTRTFALAKDSKDEKRDFCRAFTATLLCYTYSERKTIGAHGRWTNATWDRSWVRLDRNMRPRTQTQSDGEPVVVDWESV